MMRMFRRGIAHQWAAGFSLFLLLVMLVMEYRTYEQALRRHSVAQTNAELYLTKNRICNDPSARAKLAGFDRCAESEDIMMKIAGVEALYDVLERWKLCHNGRCEMFYSDLAANMPYIVALFFLFLLMLICLWFKYGLDRTVEHTRRRWSLPSDLYQDGYHIKSY